MAGELNTEVLDDPESCRTTADWLGKVNGAVEGIGDAVHGQRSASHGFWTGPAAEAARATLGRQGHDSDELDELVGKTGSALNVFAGEIDTVQRRMEQAREQARAGKLIVTPTEILPPGPGPRSGPGGGPQAPAGGPGGTDPRQPASDAAAHAAHAEKKRAFEEARQTVEDAREKEKEAHEALEKSMQDPLEAVKQTKTYGMFVLTNGLNTIKASTEAADALFDKARSWDSAASEIQARAESKPAGFAKYADKAAEAGREKAATARTQATRAQKMGGPVGDNARRAIMANPAEYMQATSKVGKVGQNVVRGVPLLGTTLSIGSGVADVAMGKDPWEAAKDTGAEIAGGAAGGAAAGAALGSVFPGVGTVIGGVAGGIIGSWAAKKGVNALE
ncbi:hypothetical protein [Bounagaea algeriensis]